MDLIFKYFSTCLSINYALSRYCVSKKDWKVLPPSTTAAYGRWKIKTNCSLSLLPYHPSKSRVLNPIDRNYIEVFSVWKCKNEKQEKKWLTMAGLNAKPNDGSLHYVDEDDSIVDDLFHVKSVSVKAFLICWKSVKRNLPIKPKPKPHIECLVVVDCNALYFGLNKPDIELRFFVSLNFIWTKLKRTQKNKDYELCEQERWKRHFLCLVGWYCRWWSCALGGFGISNFKVSFALKLLNL